MTYNNNNRYNIDKHIHFHFANKREAKIYQHADTDTTASNLKLLFVTNCDRNCKWLVRACVHDTIFKHIYHHWCVRSQCERCAVLIDMRMQIDCREKVKISISVIIVSAACFYRCVFVRVSYVVMMIHVNRHMCASKFHESVAKQLKMIFFFWKKKTNKPVPPNSNNKL